MSDDLIERLEFCAKMHPAVGYPENGKMFSEAAHRIRELESANYRLTEERDRLKGWADKYHDEVLELQARLATAEADAEADALEKAAKEIECGCNGWCMDPVNCSREDAEAIRALKPKAEK